MTFPTRYLSLWFPLKTDIIPLTFPSLLLFPTARGIDEVVLGYSNVSKAHPL
jgi:hypothetical protein